MLTTDHILALVAQSLQQILEDSDLELDAPLGPATLLNRDLCLSSVEVLELFGLLDVAMKRRLPYDLLIMRDGQYLSELSVSDLVDFAFRNQQHLQPPAHAM